MSTTASPEKNGDLDALAEWYDLPFGRDLKARVAAKLGRILAEIPLQQLLHLGLAGFECSMAGLQRDRMISFTDVACEHFLLGDQNSLPLQPESIDCVVSLHGLDLANNPHAMLREAERIVALDGHLLIVGFNPLSLFGLYKPLRKLWPGSHTMPWKLNFYGANRLRDWLKLLNFEIKSVHTLNYQPAIQSANFIRKLALVNAVGRMVFPPLGNIYILVAQKRSLPLTPFKFSPAPFKRKLRGGILKPSMSEPTTRTIHIEQTD